jgi:hypothetical protein
MLRGIDKGTGNNCWLWFIILFRTYWPPNAQSTGSVVIVFHEGTRRFTK